MTDLIPPLLLPLLATLPAMIGIQTRQAISSRKRRSLPPVSRASVHQLAKALKLHPLTTSATLELSATGLPVLTTVRDISDQDVDSIIHWVKGQRFQAQETIYTLHPEAQQ